MSFYEFLQNEKNKTHLLTLQNASNEDILRVLSKEPVSFNHEDFLIMLSQAAQAYLEPMAEMARRITLQNFGRTIQLYTPIYVSNHCVNQCVYCGFNIHNHIQRASLSLEEVEIEAKTIANTGLKSILLLTGESSKHASIAYIKDCVNILKKYFESVSVEIYPLTTTEYKELVAVGVDGVTVYQEVYDEDIYKEVHISGPKSNFKFRLDTALRACEANVRTVNIGALLGLSDFRMESFYTGSHARYLQDKFPATEISVSIPRIRPHVGSGSFQPKYNVSDKDLVQIILALRLFLPKCGITLSTRESSWLRDNLIELGITKMSAGTTTQVGGHSQKDVSKAQFDISDGRSVLEISKMLYSKGYQPIFKDWMNI